MIGYPKDIFQELLKRNVCRSTVQQIVRRAYYDVIWWYIASVACLYFVGSASLRYLVELSATGTWGIRKVGYISGVTILLLLAYAGNRIGTNLWRRSIWKTAFRSGITICPKCGFDLIIREHLLKCTECGSGFHPPTPK